MLYPPVNFEEDDPQPALREREPQEEDFKNCVEKTQIYEKASEKSQELAKAAR